MAKGSHLTKAKKNDSTPASRRERERERPNKPKPAETGTDKGVEKQVSVDQVRCVDCDNVITDDTKALNCEKCQKLWKCTSCIGIRASTYDDLISDVGRELHWFCELCHRDIMNQTSMTQLLGALEKLTLKMTAMEEELGSKADKSMIRNLETMVEKKMSEGYDAFSASVERQLAKEMQDMRGVVNKELQKSCAKDNIVSVEEKVMKLVETVEKQRADNHDLRDYVQDAVRDKLQEDQQEMEDIKKRSKNIIIHGLIEVPDGDSESRKKAEDDQLQDLLHGMKCDDLSIQSIVRFGAYQDSREKPRPLKVELASEQQREKAITEAKNLRGNLTFGQVFIQRDLTVKQREKRRQLVQELKQRKANGETDLIIIQDKIVVRRK